MININFYLIDVNDISLDEIFIKYELSNEEKSKIMKFSNDLTKKEMAISMYFKKKYIGDFKFNESNKPITDNIYFNISHSYGVVILVTSNECEIGCDIEKIRGYSLPLLTRMANQNELNYIISNERFYHIWTNKEAILKCLGSGLIMELDSVPALPLDGVRKYQNEDINIKQIKYKDYIISIACKSVDSLNICECK